MTDKQYSLENIEAFIGKELGVSDWIEIDQSRVNMFAEATGDFQWIHVDEQRARNGPIGSTIAHGFLTLALLPMLNEQVGSMPSGIAYALNYGTDKVRFINFVKVGSRVRNRVSLQSATPKSGGVLIKTLNTIEIEGEDKPAMVAETLTLVFAG